MKHSLHPQLQALHASFALRLQRSLGLLGAHALLALAMRANHNAIAVLFIKIVCA